jgi:hypothetical protein
MRTFLGPQHCTGVLASLLLGTAATVSGAGSNCTLDVFPDISCTQNAFAWTNATDFAACCADCEAHEECTACEWASRSGRQSKGPCHLKREPGPKISQPGTTCGISKLLPPTPTPPTPTPPQQLHAWPPVWPMPSSYLNGSTATALTPSFSLGLSERSGTSSTLTAVLERYTLMVLGQAARRPAKAGGSLSQLVVTVHDSDEAPPAESTDESYTLAVPSSGSATLIAANVYGAIRGLETFSQLVTYNFSRAQFVIRGTPWQISDSPRFSFRGLMLDTSRHFIPVPMIERLLDGMAACKLSVLHWHISDDQAFPLDIPTLPKLWKQSYAGRSRYTTGDAKHMVE